MEPKKVAAVVVTYNRKDLLCQCLEAVLGQTYPCDVLVVDNASTDGTADMLQGLIAQLPGLFTRNTGANIGGAGGFHFGMKWAVEAGYDYVWIMDDDCLPNKNALEKLMDADDALGNSQYGFLSSTVLWTDGTQCVMNRQKVLKRAESSVDLLRAGLVPIYQATFVSLLFPVSTIRQYGLPIHDYFIWGDDIEYTRRIALRNGEDCYLAGQSVVTHATKNNVGSDIATDDIARLERYTLAFRNESYTYRQEGWKGVLFYLARCGRGVLRITFHAKEHRAKRFLALGKGILQGIVFRPDVVSTL